MAFTDTQTRQLKGKLDAKHVKTRNADGATLHYVEGWHVIAEANRIFGFDAWDRRTLSTRCVWTGMSGKHYATAYIARVRVRVRAGEIMVVRDGSGTGQGKGFTPGEAHEIALKSAETDATKRALTTFGNRFGLALYDPERAGVREPSLKARLKQVVEGPWTLKSASGEETAKIEDPDAYLKGLKRVMADAQSIELLFNVWEANLPSVRALNAWYQNRDARKTDIGQTLVAHLRQCAVALVKTPTGTSSDTRTDGQVNGSGTTSRPRIDKSQLALSEIKRVRSKEHLRFVARQPCLVCGRMPSQAHHVRFAQPRGLGLKVSDQFTVPLCAIHHTENHATGNERQWWQDQNVDPLAEAEKLWQPGANEVQESGNQ